MRLRRSAVINSFREQDPPIRVEPLKPYKASTLARIRKLIAAKMIPTHHCVAMGSVKKVLLPRVACGKTIQNT